MKRCTLRSRVAVDQVRNAETAEDAETFSASAERGGRRESRGRPRERGGFLLIVVLLLGVAATGCVQQKRFRYLPARTACFPETAEAPQLTAPSDQRPSLDCRSSLYKEAFIEFQEDGQPYEPKQVEMARTLIEREKSRAANGKIITVLYIHGWKNNAAEAEPGGKPKDVEKFQGALYELGARAKQAAEAAHTPRVPVVGIYIAWRGKTLMGPSWFTFTSLWSRRNTANNIGDGRDLGPTIQGIIDLTNQGNETSRVLLIGHSFGARVLEHAIESKQVTLFDGDPAVGLVRPRVDLVLYVNSANDSRLTMGHIQALQTAGIKVHHPEFTDAKCDSTTEEGKKLTPDERRRICGDYPLLVAISSKGDSATKYLLPAANTINGDSLVPELQKNLPPLPTGTTFLDPPPSAGKVRKTAAGHFGFLQSHVARSITCPPMPLPVPLQEQTVDKKIDDAVHRAVANALGRPEDIAEQRKREQAQKDEAARRAAAERARVDRVLHPVCSDSSPDCRFMFRTLSETPACFQVDQRVAVEGKPPFNSTPFWVFNVEPTVIKDHGDIWNVSLIELLAQMMAPRGFFDPQSPRVQLRKD